MLKNEEYLNRVRKSRIVNFDLPGCIELEDPNWFLPDLRPVEDFPHTPIIPIAEERMKEYNDLVRIWSSKIVEYHYSVDKFITFGMLVGTLSVIYYLFK